MAAQPDALNWFTPLPPARNGIADYAAMLLGEMARLTPCVCYCEDPLADAPDGVEVRDPVQAFRHLGAGSRILHQIGNNEGHVFALDALRRHGGVASLHDLSLLYVYELGTPRREVLFGHMQAPSRALGETYARHWKEAGLKTSANYVLFDMVGEVLSRSRRVIVHSDYARRKLAATHGAEAAEKLVVIPHFAKAIADRSAEAARERLGVGPEEILILTSGFATRVKRFDWLVEALDRLRREGRRFRWIHAGQEKADEVKLTERMHAGGLGDVARVTGYLSEDDLDSCIMAADIVVNLRFPSVGESSGTLARAFAAGRCCVVNDTAAYSEIPRDIVVHIPVFDTVGALVRALDRLIADADLREAFGQRARHFARTSLSVATVARRYLEAIDGSRPPGAVRSSAGRAAKARQPSGPVRLSVDVVDAMPDLSTLLRPAVEDFELTLWFATADRLAAAALDEPSFVASLLGPHVDVEAIRFVHPGASERRSVAGERIGILVSGRAC